MTSRDVPRRSRDRVGVMIQWALRKGFGDATPAPGGWARIRERLAEETEQRPGLWGWAPQPAARAFARSLFQLAGARVELSYEGTEWRHAVGRDTFCVADQYGTLLRRLAVL